MTTDDNMMMLHVPEHAVRYLARLLRDQRRRMAGEDDLRLRPGHMLQGLAAWDSQEALEDAIPPECEPPSESGAEEWGQRWWRRHRAEICCMITFLMGAATGLIIS